MKFKLTWHLVAQGLMGVVQLGNLMYNSASPKMQPTIMVVVTIAQLLLHVYAHNQIPPVVQ